jgi:hypothetical protein
MALKNDTAIAHKLVEVMELILKMTKEVYAAIRLVNEENKGFDEDMFTLCTIAIDHGIIETVSGLLALTGTTKPAKLVLGADGSLAIEAQTLVQAVAAANTEVATPSLAVQQATLIIKLVGLMPELTGLTRSTASLVRKGYKNIKGFMNKDTTEKWEAL